MYEVKYLHDIFQIVTNTFCGINYRIANEKLLTCFDKTKLLVP